MDKGTFHELWAFGVSRGERGSAEEAPADGVVTGFGQVTVPIIYVYSQDFTVSGGTLAETHANKICLCLDAALKSRCCPIIGINDSWRAPVSRTAWTHWPVSAPIFYRNTLASA